MTAEDAYDILEAVADINGYSNRLKKRQASIQEQKDEQQANENRERLTPFSFDMCDIKPGEVIEYWENNSSGSGKFCTVKDSKHVEYEGKLWSLTGLVKHLMDTDMEVAGPRYFKYKGEWLNDIRKRMGAWR